MKARYKNILLLGATASLFSFRAIAYPGWNLIEAKEYVDNHKFLNLYEEKRNGEHPAVIGFWFLEGDKRFTLMYHDMPKTNKIFAVSMRLSQFESGSVTPCLQQETKETYYFCGENGYDLDIWHRNSTIAMDQITRAFSKEVALDFSGSKMIYKGPQFDYLKIIKNEIPENTNDLVIGEEVVYLGNLYTYISTSYQEKGSSGPVEQRAKRSLHINDLNEANKAIDRIKRNMGKYILRE